MPDAGLPRLLYLGDVPVESSYYGSALLYRLLQNYPVDGLRIAEGNLDRSRPERRLPRVVYETVQVGFTRLLYTRLHMYQSVWLSHRGVALAGKVPALLAGFEPEAVLTVAHGHLWVAAAEFARRRGLPLHLIVHDDWPRITGLPQRFADRVDRQFAAVYRAAASRMCVSPFMRDCYREQYGSDGEVLYPSRAADCPAFDRPPERVLRGNDPLIVAFAGTVNLRGTRACWRGWPTASSSGTAVWYCSAPTAPASWRRWALIGRTYVPLDCFLPAISSIVSDEKRTCSSSRCHSRERGTMRT